MKSRNEFISQVLPLLVGELLLSAVMVAVFAALGYYETGVLLGAAAGSLIATLNHAILILSVNAAAKKAENQNVKGGQALIQMSYMGRLIGLFLILVLCAKSGVFNLIALALPLAFSRPVLVFTDHFNQKKGGVNE